MADPRTTPYLSLFPVPPTEDPLSEDGQWLKVAYTELALRKVIDGHATDQAHGTSLSGHIAASFFTRRRFFGDCEVWGRPYGGQLGAALETWRLFFFTDVLTDSPSGWLVYIGGGIGKNTVLRRYDAGGFTDVASHASGYASALLLRLVGADVEVWAVNNGQDYNNPANWYQRIGYTDATYRSDLYLGMAIEDPTNGGLSWHGIGGGDHRRQQIYRYVRPPVDKGREISE